MVNDTQNKKIVAVLGCGVIGQSWVSVFMQAGYSVQIWDTDPKIEHKLKFLRIEFPEGQYTTHTTPQEAVTGAVFVQESGPELLEKKQELYGAIAPLLGQDAIVASSTSTLQPTQLQKRSVFADRIVIGHPFKPPHILPLVEVIGGVLTTEETVTRTMEFYRQLGKTPIRLNIERLGHLANRIQAAVQREAVDAVATGQASVEDVDLAVTMALGPRWSVMGPFETFYLGGGEGGLSHFLDHLGDAFEYLWDDANRPIMTDDLQAKLIYDTAKRVIGKTTNDLIERRNYRLMNILKARDQNT